MMSVCLNSLFPISVPYLAYRALRFSLKGMCFVTGCCCLYA